MKYDDAFLDRAHRFSTRNFEDSKLSSLCACFTCLEVFPACDVVSSYPEAKGYYAEVDGRPRNDTQTADCPKCGLDSVLADISGLPIFDEEFLRAMQKRWVLQFKASDPHASDF